jgi:hypothetical protein
MKLPAPGEKLNLGRWAVGAKAVEEYLTAVEDGSLLYRDLAAVPPMALAARALGALLEELSLPPGTIHASQEIDCRRMVNPDEEVSCVATLSRPMRRGDWQLVSADFTVHGDGGEAVLVGKATVLVPMGGEEGE